MWLIENKTVLIIAHRLRTVVGADKIIMLGKGRISGKGTHEELFVGNKLYEKMYTIQQGIMETKDIFSVYEREIKALHFLSTINRTKDSITIEIDSENGRGKQRLYALFPDIFLGFNEFSGTCFPSFGKELAGGIKINFCVEVRCDVEHKPQSFLTTGQVNIAKQVMNSCYAGRKNSKDLSTNGR